MRHHDACHDGVHEQFCLTEQNPTELLVSVQAIEPTQDTLQAMEINQVLENMTTEERPTARDSPRMGQSKGILGETQEIISNAASGVASMVGMQDGEKSKSKVEEERRKTEEEKNLVDAASAAAPFEDDFTDVVDDANRDTPSEIAEDVMDSLESAKTMMGEATRTTSSIPPAEMEEKDASILDSSVHDVRDTLVESINGIAEAVHLAPPFADPTDDVDPDTVFDNMWASKPDQDSDEDSKPQPILDAHAENVGQLVDLDFE